VRSGLDVAVGAGAGGVVVLQSGEGVSQFTAKSQSTGRLSLEKGSTRKERANTPQRTSQR
jgi:hypothetical protein